ncbi:hypothetical protein AVEN_220934-1 [Araneus ventricosus]|uniref:Uncharacterized protein n=1 Tax=Araneus ventricosus TaxID=182803 RepID=A0A4Y2JAU3_ARAVE|nr:hypothetical protein AVEN_220934-1 [Araneus ventricosus]
MNSVFQRELLANNEAGIWASTNSNNAKIWIDTHWNRQDIERPLTMTHTLIFQIKESNCCEELGDPLYYAACCPFTTSYHLTKSIQDLETIWWNKVVKNKLLRIKTRNLLKFLLDKRIPYIARS